MKYFSTSFFMAGVEGLEPSQAVLETDVLPLTLYSYKFYYTYNNNINTEKKQVILEKSLNI